MEKHFRVFWRGNKEKYRKNFYSKMFLETFVVSELLDIRPTMKIICIKLSLCVVCVFSHRLQFFSFFVVENIFRKLRKGLFTNFTKLFTHHPAGQDYKNTDHSKKKNRWWDGENFFFRQQRKKKFSLFKTEKTFETEHYKLYTNYR
jgi:hypothetical protein